MTWSRLALRYHRGVVCDDLPTPLDVTDLTSVLDGILPRRAG